MKIRIKGNSIRFRLTKPEVEQFEKDGYLEERTEFGDATFVYALKDDTGVDDLSASFFGQKMTMRVPSKIARQWTTTNAVGYDNSIDLGEGRNLFLLLEKDFKCIDSTEDQSDNYEHPVKAC